MYTTPPEKILFKLHLQTFSVCPFIFCSVSRAIFISTSQASSSPCVCILGGKPGEQAGLNLEQGKEGGGLGGLLDVAVGSIWMTRDSMKRKREEGNGESSRKGSQGKSGRWKGSQSQRWPLDIFLSGGLPPILESHFRLSLGPSSQAMQPPSLPWDRGKKYTAREWRRRH